MDGLRVHGANWRAIQRIIPTRTLVQIRTHAQKYFAKHPDVARKATAHRESQRAGGARPRNAARRSGTAGGALGNNSSIGCAGPGVRRQGAATAPAAAAAGRVSLARSADDDDGSYENAMDLDEENGDNGDDGDGGDDMSDGTETEGDGDGEGPDDEDDADDDDDNDDGSLAHRRGGDADGSGSYGAGDIAMSGGATGSRAGGAWAGGAADSVSGVSAADDEKMFTATLRHVALEPVHPLDPLGISFRFDAGANACVVQGFTVVPSSTSAPSTGGKDAAASAPSHLALAAAEDGDLVRIGDVLLGVSGVATVGMDAPTVARALSAARSVTSGGVVVLHLCDAGIDDAAVDEAQAQMEEAATQLIGSRAQLEAAQQAAYNALLSAPSAPSDAARRHNGGVSTGRVVTIGGPNEEAGVPLGASSGAGVVPSGGSSGAMAVGAGRAATTTIVTE